jgi:hypothetical protein
VWPGIHRGCRSSTLVPRSIVSCLMIARAVIPRSVIRRPAANAIDGPRGAG